LNCGSDCRREGRSSARRNNLFFIILISLKRVKILHIAVAFQHQLIFNLNISLFNGTH
jgi:hypothetical protein